jgi:hypothetical protein
MIWNVQEDPSAIWSWCAVLVGGAAGAFVLLTLPGWFLRIPGLPPRSRIAIDIVSVTSRSFVLFALWWLGRAFMGHSGVSGWVYWVGVVLFFFFGMAVALKLMGDAEQKDWSALRLLRELTGGLVSLACILLIAEGRIPLQGTIEAATPQAAPDWNRVVEAARAIAWQIERQPIAIVNYFAVWMAIGVVIGLFWAGFALVLWRGPKEARAYSLRIAGLVFVLLCLWAGWFGLFWLARLIAGEFFPPNTIPLWLATLAPCALAPIPIARWMQTTRKRVDVHFLVAAGDEKVIEQFDVKTPDHKNWLAREAAHRSIHGFLVGVPILASTIGLVILIANGCIELDTPRYAFAFNPDSPPAAFEVARASASCGRCWRS